ncbi:hypothetical protein HN014_08120 [Aquimarina sp. TRL1]|uniref:hypothetical protein n=1 Tax=Aquimarina sp. (strain TRL1) TaxID=2736252 RepID=UPI00158E1F8D|nr:hypothetical protein [Aquimarina sp. TRL1]QKX04884.1 hypothetical protein HN014_08120 [Aquimarina sp. TRL1]
MPKTFDSSAPEYRWSDTQVSMDGRILTRIRGVKFAIKKEKEYFHARGEDPHSIQSGNKTPEGELILAQSEVERLQDLLEPDEDLTDMPPFDVTVSFVKKGTTKIRTYILKGCEFTDDTREMKQGDKFSEITLPIMFLKRLAA